MQRIFLLLQALDGSFPSENGDGSEFSAMQTCDGYLNVKLEGASGS